MSEVPPKEKVEKKTFSKKLMSSVASVHKERPAKRSKESSHRHNKVMKESQNSSTKEVKEAQEAKKDSKEVLREAKDEVEDQKSQKRSSKELKSSGLQAKDVKDEVEGQELTTSQKSMSEKQSSAHGNKSKIDAAKKKKRNRRAENENAASAGLQPSDGLDKENANIVPDERKTTGFYKLFGVFGGMFLIAIITVMLR